jgi:AcrR family transcriptional regulator
VGRPRHLPQDELLERAMVVFWTRGYAATSIEELVEATGAQRSTLYRAFGSKAGLLAKAMERYGELRRSAVDPEAPVETQLRQWFDRAVAGARQGLPPGCLLINSTAEYHTLEPELRAMVDAHLEMLRAWFRQCTAALRPGEDTDALAAVLFGANLSIHLMERAGAKESELRAIADAALSFVLRGPQKLEQ